MDFGFSFMPTMPSFGGVGSLPNLVGNALAQPKYGDIGYRKTDSKQPSPKSLLGSSDTKPESMFGFTPPSLVLANKYDQGTLG